MPLSLLRWSIAVLILCLVAPAALAGEPPRRPSSKRAKKQLTAKASIAPKRLVRISGGERLRHDAAASFEQMYSEARDAGLRLWVISGHRSWQEQKYLYRLYRRGLGPRAARPGRSNHQRGTAVDISVGSTDTLTYEWLAANACRFGFKRTVRSEPWHWEYRPRTTPKPDEGEDCLSRPLTPQNGASQGVATPSPS
ncbi:M15 family metallopeptidase [Hyalangium versicolor]|uniref:M15 family metallopeptidase n=1 Tax=Hyalangium versicolor TaxID=2861190 RepID=UPI001CC98579|nr:D-alanyl-D-alanine carboxypeptidase family protein [Hyalangium versicolor]